MNKFTNKVKRTCAAASALFLLAGAVCASDISDPSIETDSSSGLKYRAILTESESEVDVTLHETVYSPYFELPGTSIFSEYTERTRELCYGDIYVSPNGNDSGQGTLEDPFRTIERARDEIRSRKTKGTLPEGGVTVSLMAGTYKISSEIKFTQQDSGTADCPITYTAFGDGEVIFSAALELSAADFSVAEGDIASRFGEAVAGKIVMADLKKYGVTSDMLTLYRTGSATMSGTNVELSVDRETYQLARYPDNDVLISSGIEAKSGNAKLVMSDEVNERVKTWRTVDGVWALGMIYTDYKDSTSSVTIDTSSKVIAFNNAETNGWSQSMPYYFFNVPEELDIPGEWYLDRENCVLYMYPREDINDSSIELALGYNSNIISCNGCGYITFDGITMTGTKGNCLTANNVNNFTVKDCDLYNIGKNGIEINGTYCTVSECELSYIGLHGIVIGGGNKATLTKAYNLVDNNLVTHWGLNQRAFTAGISGSGQGLTVSHNEIAYSTSSALGVQGNLNVTEYNLVHDCTTLASDCGAYYNGSSWTSGSCDVRYNCFYNIGSDKTTPAALYWDDGMAYQRAYGNLLLNISGYGVSMGGGFANTIVNNAIINTGKAPYHYDPRPYYGNRMGDSFYSIGGFLWNLYKSTPYETQVWRENFPLLSQILQDSSDKYAPHFAYNPAFSLFSDNIYVNSESIEGGVGVQNVHYSTSLDNYTTNIDGISEIFVDAMHGDYRLREDSVIWESVRDFEEIPYSEIGRY